MYNFEEKFFFGVYEKSDWIIIETFKRCETFNNVLDLKNELIRTVNLSSQNAKLELLKSHPELTGKIGIKKLTKESLNEQKSAGLNECTLDEYNELHTLNENYNKKFRFPFIIAVTGLNVTKIIKSFRSRILNEYNEELHEAIKQVHKIASIRIDQKIKNMENI